MEQTFTSQPVEHLSHWTDTDVEQLSQSGDQLKQQKDELALHTEEKHLRHMSPSVRVGKRKEVVPLKSLGW
jgi:hypothetical protein